MDDYQIGIISQPILGLFYRIVSILLYGEKHDITCITAGSAAVNVTLHRTI